MNAICKIKNRVDKLLNSFRRFKYNRMFCTSIISNNASLKATYGVGVSVSMDTIVTDDVFISDYSYINAHSSVENCIIGKYCSISSNVYISPYEHNLDLRTTHPIAQNNEPRKRVIIGNDVLICLNAVIKGNYSAM